MSTNINSEKIYELLSLGNNEALLEIELTKLKKLIHSNWVEIEKDLESLKNA
jgi:hypothetical protein